jgi:hypothetical protein
MVLEVYEIFVKQKKYMKYVYLYKEEERIKFLPIKRRKKEKAHGQNPPRRQCPFFK